MLFKGAVISVVHIAKKSLRAQRIALQGARTELRQVRAYY